MHPTEIETLIRAGLPDSEVEVRGDDGVHFEAVVVSPVFEGQRTLARHRAVYATLGQKMGTDIHALSLVTMTPDEKARKQRVG